MKINYRAGHKQAGKKLTGSFNSTYIFKLPVKMQFEGIFSRKNLKFHIKVTSLSI
jgi:hypothetical protein